ncbi:beta strand repeat-containing protein [Streptomyces sp. NPDC005931]|uniref:beta strand repeat-containing protein n=1 Tax=Streptomyces sp. NPDC005931 TaxID=3364737 RepID=UPI0036ACB851
MPATITLVTTSPNPSVFGQPVTLKATVIPIGAGTPTGTVTFTVGGGPAVTAPVVGGTATATVDDLPVGTHPVTATYSGDASFTPSTGTTLQAVIQATTRTKVTSSPDPSAYGQPVTITATVTPVPPGEGTPTGTVIFVIGGGPTLTAPLVNGTATVTVNLLSVGPHAITAIYGGDATYLPSFGTDRHTVQSKALTTTTVTSSPDPSVVGQPVTFTATVAPDLPQLGTPTGTVTFSFGDGSAPVTVPLVGGVATVSHTYTDATGSPYTVTAAYSGNSNFKPSTGTDTQTVQPADTTTTVVSSPDPSVVGQPVTFTATVSPVAPGAGTPTGTVTFTFGDGSAPQTVPLAGGTATVTHAYTTTTGSPFTVTAAYSGDGSFTASQGTDTQTVGVSDTTTTVVSSPDPSVVGQPVTFTATVAPVAPGAGTPTGTVVFDFGDGSPAQSGTLVDGTATVTHAYTSAGGSPFTVTATYAGNGDFTGSSGTDTHTVDPSATTTTVTTAPDPSAVGQEVTVTATVAPVAPGSGTPTGNVTIDFGDGSPAVTVSLAGGTASVTHTYTSTSGTPYVVSATYGGDADFAGSSGSDTQTVNAAATEVTLASAPDPSVVGEPVTFTASVAAVAPGAGSPTGAVTFDFGDGSAPQTVPVAGGTASVTHTYTSASGSPYTATATYGGDADFAGSSGSDTQTVNAAATEVTLASAPDPSVVGEPVTFTASVAAVAPGAGSPTGAVTFDFGDGSAPQTVPVAGGTASVTHTYISASGSPYTATATYGGDADFAGSSGSDTQTVNAAATEVTLASAPDPSVVGEPVTFTASVAAVAPGAGSPTGAVTFDFGDGSAPQTVPVAGGTASVTHTYISASGSPYTATATYGGDADFTGSSGTDTQTVEAAGTTTTVSTGPDPSVVGQPVDITVTVASVAPGGGTPTGDVIVTFGDGSPAETVTLAGGTATLTHTYNSTVGSPYTVIATYAGNTDFDASTGSDSQAVDIAQTTTTVTSAPDPSVFGEPVTISATVAPTAPGAGTPGGTVFFSVSGGPALSAPLVGGTATVVTDAIAVGTRTVTATYGGSTDFGPSEGIDTHTVNQASTTTEVTSAPDPSPVGVQVTATAAVTSTPPGAGTPTGTVTFDFGDGSAPVSAGVVGGTATATHTYATTAGSPYTITATYGGDGSFTGSSDTDSQTVGAVDTTTTVTSAPDPSVVGESVAVTATVAADNPGAGSPTGTVTFDFGDGSPAATGTLVGGTATVTHTYATTAGSPYTITVGYVGNGDFNSSTGTDTQTVNQAATTLGVTSAPDPSVVGESVTVTATVAADSPGAGTPTGTVTFDFGDGSPAATGTLVGGTATVTHAYTGAAGSPYTLTATYGGDADFAAASGSDTQTVNQATTTATVTSAPDPSVVGETVTVTATVAADSPGAGTPTGTVTIDFGDGSPAVTEALTGGTATTTHVYTDVTGSPYTIGVSYGGDADFAGDTATDTQTVNQAATTLGVTSAPDPSVVGESVTVTATVAADSPGAGTPTGTVTFDFGDGSGTVSATVAGGLATATHVYTDAAGSPYTIGATYGGDANFAGDTATDTQTVNQAATTLAVASGPDPSVEGEPVTVTATVAADSPGGGTPTGTVTFDFGDGSGTVTETVTGGIATTTHAYADDAGSPYTITASYGGDANYTGDTATDTQVVGPVV